MRKLLQILIFIVITGTKQTSGLNRLFFTTYFTLVLFLLKRYEKSNFFCVFCQDDRPQIGQIQQQYFLFQKSASYQKYFETYR